MQGSFEDWLSIMRNTAACLYPYPWFSQLLRLTPTIKKCIVTNGHPLQQTNKYLALAPSFEGQTLALFCANNYRPKPSPVVAKYVMNYYGLSPSSCVMVGDSNVDASFALNSSLDFVGIRSASKEFTE